MRADAIFCLVPLAAALVAGCSTSETHPPELVRGPEQSTPVTCGELRDAGETLTNGMPGTLLVSGAPAACVGEGADCPLDDVAGDACDGGADAATPIAQCNAGSWVGRCVTLATDAGP